MAIQINNVTNTITSNTGNINLQTVSAITNGRITSVSSDPFPAAPQTNVTQLFFTPYLGDVICLRGPSQWEMIRFTEKNINLSGLAANSIYDIFGFLFNNDLSIEFSLPWTNNTTRAENISMLDGVYVKNSDNTRKYLGTIRTTSAGGETEDLPESRCIWNYWNRRKKVMLANGINTASWNVTSLLWIPINGNTTVGEARVQFVLGASEDIVEFNYTSTTQADTLLDWVAIGLCLNNTNSNNATKKAATIPNLINPATMDMETGYKGQLAPGFHFIQAVERIDGVGGIRRMLGRTSDYQQSSIEGYIFA